MKNKMFLFALLVLTLLFQTNVLSQYINIYGGVKFLNFKNSNIQLSYLDESPSPDYFYSNTYVKESMVYNLSVTADGFKHLNSIYYDLTLNLFAGEHFLAGDLNVSAGYPLYISKKKNITILPVFSAGYGLSGRSLGKLINHSIYIKVNNTRFMDYSDVDVSLSRSYVSLRPAMNILFDLSKKFQIRLNAAYLFSIYTNNLVRFSGKDNSGNNVSDSEGLDEQNVSFTVNGNQTKESPIDIKGIEFRIGFGFNIGKTPKSETK